MRYIDSMLKTLNQLNKNASIIDTISMYAFLLSLFFLPLNMWLNNLLTLIFIGFQLISFGLDFKRKIQLLRENFKLLLILTSPFLIVLLGTIYSSNLHDAWDDIVRLLPILCLPLFFTSNTSVFKSMLNLAGYVLVIGCIIAALICWSANVITILENQESLKRLLSPVYANQGLTRVLDIHASYMAILVNTSIAFLIYRLNKENTTKQNMIINIAILILVLFLFHLLARAAILVFLLSGLVYVIAKKRYIILGLSVAVFAIGIVFIINTEKNYLRDRLLNNLNIFDNKESLSKKDDRFDRLMASYEVFLQHPVIGPGTADDDELRRAIFRKNRDVVAYNNNYNSHNQLFEYLSTYGLIGALIYIILIGRILGIVIRQRNWLFLFIFTAFFLGSLTESLLERTLGITYFAICISFLVVIRNEKLCVR